MSKDKISENEESAKVCCANCGVAAVDDIKLKDCPHCDLVRYCGDKCQQAHREFHEGSCKQRRADMFDEILFKQPESTHLGDCPICFLPMPLKSKARAYHTCCGAETCNGCTLARYESEMDQCPFCRASMDLKHCEKYEKRMLRRAEANEPKALETIGNKYFDEEDYKNAFRYYTRASELGNVHASFQLGRMYHVRVGNFVEQDLTKCIAFWEKAAIGGHDGARYALGLIEWEEERLDRAVRHWIIAASLGESESIKRLTEFYKEGHVSKDDFAKALRANQAAVDAMKSPQREKVELILRGSGSNDYK